MTEIIKPKQKTQIAPNFDLRVSNLFQNSNFEFRIWLRLGRELFYAFPLALMFLLALTPGISFTEDLGRHLLLGGIIVTTGHIPDTNLLTYTCPDFPFINHHWLSEVIFYLVHQAVGLNGLILLKALLLCAALALAMRSVPVQGISPLMVFAATLSAVALGYRAHIRPELFTYFGVALYGFFVARDMSICRLGKRNAIAGVGDPGKFGFNEAGYSCRRINLCWIIIIVYGWFWANAHIYFIFGMGMIFIYWLACWRQNIGRQKRQLYQTPQLSGAATFFRSFPRVETIGLLALIGISLINPNGWRGLVYPLQIFGNYGIAITENASPLDYWRTVYNPMLIVLPFLSLLALWVLYRLGRASALSTIAVAATADCQRPSNRTWEDRLVASNGPTSFSTSQLAGILILIVALIAAWRMARSAPLLALTLLPPLGLFVCAEKNESAHKQPITIFGTRTHFIKCVRGFWAGLLSRAGFIFVIALNLWLAFSVVSGSCHRIFPSPIGPTPFGFDDESRYLALKKLQADGLPMKIFSDYNSGSLVEYNIYPERGYVDNRPEAFPASFWQNEYEKALALGAVWEEMIARRNIQTIAVSTAGVKEKFIRTLLADRRWQLVHLDFFFAVFVRNTPANQSFLQRHAYNQEKISRFAREIAGRIQTLSSIGLWRHQVLADQIVYEIYGLICLGRNDLAWPFVWEMHLRYPDYQLVHELMRVSAPPHAAPAVMAVMARCARWPLAAKQVLDYGAVLEAQGRLDEACALYRRGRFFFPLSSGLAERRRLTFK
jgi:hypothetical protein